MKVANREESPRRKEMPLCSPDQQQKVKKGCQFYEMKKKKKSLTGLSSSFDLGNLSIILPKMYIKKNE